MRIADGESFDDMRRNPAQPAANGEPDDWDAEHDWRDIERLILRLESYRSPHEKSGASRKASPSRPRPGFNSPEDDAPQVNRDSDPLESRSRFSPARYSVVLGFAASAGGAVLLCWSFATARADLWSQGLTLAIAGQIVLTLGVLTRLEAVNRNHHALLDALSQIHHSVKEPNHVPRRRQSQSPPPESDFGRG